MARDLSRARAILIANGSFEHPQIGALPATDCVIAMNELLNGPLCGWSAERITILDNIATPDQLARKVIAAVREAQDVLLVYYVGHGFRTRTGQLALALQETDRDPEALPHTAMLYANLADILRGCQAATKLVILDCCHAELGGKASDLFQGADLADAYPVDGLYFIGASKRDEGAKYPQGGTLTYFTQALIEVVQGGISGQPEELRLDQIFLEVRARLVKARLPEPVDAGIRGARQYPFARNAAWPGTKPADQADAASTTPYSTPAGNSPHPSGPRSALAPPAGRLNAPRTSPPRDDLAGGTRHFLGRGPEVQMLCSLLTDQGQSRSVVVICAVNGMAGIGKTALADHTAHQVKDEFPDGQLNIDLHGYTVGATSTPAEKALEILLNRVGVPKNEIPYELDERAALWRAKLADKRMLVVLDNARDAAQVRPLLPGSPGCGVLITSRDSLASLDDAYPLRLDTLSAHDALTLFRRIVGSEPVDEHLNAIEQMIALCGYLPLALRIIAARLRAWPEPTMLLDRLQKERARLTQLTDGERSVLAAFAVSYDSLPSNQQHMFTMLGLVPGTDFDARAAAAIAGIGLEEARQDLEGLINANLLIADGAGRMHFHDLLREYAHHLGSTAVDPHDQTVTVERLLYSNLAAARAAGKLLPSHEMRVDDYPIDVPASAWEPATEEDARRWLLVERANLTLLIECTQGLASARLGTIVGNDLLELGYTDDARSCLEHAAGQFSAIGDQLGQAETEQGLGLTELRFGDYDKAIAHFSKAIHLFHAIADGAGRAHAQCQLGHLYLRLGQHETAAGYFTDADTVFRELGDQIGHAKAQRGLGHIAINRSRLDEAGTHYREADQACLDTGDRIGHAHTQRALARVAADQGRLDEASVHYLTADQVYLDINSRAGHGAAQWGLGHVALRAGRPHDAVNHFTSAREEFRNAGDCAYEASAERGLGEVALQCGDYPTALRHFTRAGTIYEQTSDKGGQVTTQQDIARVATAQGDLTAAQRALGKALELSPEGPLADSIRAELDSLSGKV